MSKKITDIVAISRIRKILESCQDEATANRVLEFVVDERRHAEHERIQGALAGDRAVPPLAQGGPL